MRRWLLGLLAGVGLFAVFNSTAPAQEPPLPRFYYYPYVYYPHNFHAPVQFDNLYYRYPQERQIPVYNANWYNPYVMPHPYHKGHHFILDVF